MIIFIIKIFVLTYLIIFQDINNFFRKIINCDVDFCTKNKICQDIFQNIHFQLINIVAYKTYSNDYHSLLPQILYRTFYLGQQNTIENQCSNLKEHKFSFPTKIDETYNKGIKIVHFISLGKKINLPSIKYDQYCLQINIGAVKCLQFEKPIHFEMYSIENICDLCFHHSEINLEALKHLTECMSIITKDQWKVSSKFIYKVLMGQINHHLPSIHDQCILLFKKCLDFEDLDYLMHIIMTEISWSLRIKFYLLTEIVSKYGAKQVYYNICL